MEKVSLMQLPDRPNLRHLWDQGQRPRSLRRRAKRCRRTVSNNCQTVRLPSWPELKQHVESLEEAVQLKQAIAANDVARVEGPLTSNPELRQILIDDVPLMAVAQPGRIPMMELLVRYGADVNALCWGWFPVLFTPCENLKLEPLQWLVDHGADPNRGKPNDPGTALDYVIQTYPRDRPRAHTPIFHALTDFKGVNPEVAQLFIARGADLTIRARVRGHYERPGEVLDVSAAEYAAIFPLR